MILAFHRSYKIETTMNSSFTQRDRAVQPQWLTDRLRVNHERKQLQVAAKIMKYRHGIESLGFSFGDVIAIDTYGVKYGNVHDKQNTYRECAAMYETRVLQLGCIILLFRYGGYGIVGFYMLNGFVTVWYYHVYSLYIRSILYGSVFYRFAWLHFV